MTVTAWNWGTTVISAVKKTVSSSPDNSPTGVVGQMKHKYHLHSSQHISVVCFTVTLLFCRNVRRTIYYITDVTMSKEHFLIWICHIFCTHNTNFCTTPYHCVYIIPSSKDSLLLTQNLQVWPMYHKMLWYIYIFFLCQNWSFLWCYICIMYNHLVDLSELAGICPMIIVLF